MGRTAVAVDDCYPNRSPLVVHENINASKVIEVRANGCIQPTGRMTLSALADTRLAVPSSLQASDNTYRLCGWSC